jgi:hypothetical protein
MMRILVKDRPMRTRRLRGAVFFFAATMLLGACNAKVASAENNSGAPAAPVSESYHPYPLQFELERGAEGYTFKLAESGLPLYASSADSPGKSACDAQCARLWRAVIADSDAKSIGLWTIIARADGARQWAYKDQPVYTFAGPDISKLEGSSTFRPMPPFR